MKDKCFACDRKLGRNPAVADTHEDQWVFVGSECFKRILASGTEGWQPPKGGPRLWMVTRERAAYHHARGADPSGRMQWIAEHGKDLGTDCASQWAKRYTKQRGEKQ